MSNLSLASKRTKEQSMQQTLILIGGGLNVLFGLLHLWLGWSLHQATHLAPGDRVLAEMLNVVVTLLIFFFVYTSFFQRQELLTTGLGKAVLWLVVLMYLSRAIEEVVLAPAFSAVIFGACLLVAGVYAAGLFLKGGSAA